MIPPLLEVNLTIGFHSLPADRKKLLQYFLEINRALISKHRREGDVDVFELAQGEESLHARADQIQVLSAGTQRFSSLRPRWEQLVESFLTTFDVDPVQAISLLYLNELELEDLQSFRDTVSIGFDMPVTLMERIEFFRSEFTYRYDFGEIHVWLQPDWDEATEAYCIQLSLESRLAKDVARADVVPAIQQMHEGIKDVFHQILSKDYVERLKQ